jgi:hypothetical protein
LGRARAVDRVGERHKETLNGFKGAVSLDDPSAFHPTFAIFAEGRLPWALIPPGFKVFDRMPGLGIEIRSL